MIFFSIFLAMLSIAFCVIILFKLESIKLEKLEKIIKDNYVVLPKLKALPNYNDVDPDNKTLRDVLNSMTIENWTLDFYNYSYDLYEFHFSNPQKSIKINTRLRSRDINTLVVAGFHVRSKEGVISYDETESNKDISILIKQYLWKIVCDKNQDKYDEQFSHYQIIKESIDKELRTLRRDETLLSILD
ncbi:MAG TPA: hypothetical protein PLC25_05570 [Bacilli bacterium]|mgnify:CR=1 FL=1|nr:hypothetical protein [Bacilli bacterium]